MHGAIHLPDLQAILTEYSDVPLVSISNSQRRPMPTANWIGTVRHGFPEAAHQFSPGPGRYLAFLGRISPEKGLERAIEIACRSGNDLRIAAKIYPEDRAYFECTIEPLLHKTRHFVEFIGEVGGKEKEDFLGGAKALLFPIQWEEPFGLVMIEAMAVGTPVIAWNLGSVPEVISDGLNGYVVHNVDQAVEAAQRLDRISRHGVFVPSPRKADVSIQSLTTTVRFGPTTTRLLGTALRCVVESTTQIKSLKGCLPQLRALDSIVYRSYFVDLTAKKDMLRCHTPWPVLRKRGPQAA